METMFLYIIYKIFALVLILPMRNGNLKQRKLRTSYFDRSYPTYEEWKPRNLAGNSVIDASSYPTYEEWKHSVPQFPFQATFVLILPMRNGN